MSLILDPAMDGVTHVNMYSKSATAFGRMLSNFYRTPLSLPEGQFQSVEGYWYYLSLPSDWALPGQTVPAREQLKHLYGFQAKSTGRALRNALRQSVQTTAFVPDFPERILAAIAQKLDKHPDMFLPRYRGLPIVHYYAYGSVIRDQTNAFPWLTAGLNRLVSERYERQSAAANGSL